MITKKTLISLEYDKIVKSVSEYAVTDRAKSEICETLPVCDLKEAEFLLDKTEEAHKLLFTYSVPKIFYFSDVSEQLKRVDMGGTLIISDILKVADNLKSARLIKTAIKSVNDDSIKILPEVASRLYVNADFEKEVSDKIISQDELSDTASPKLFSLRKEIREINSKIREKLNSFARGNDSKYLQDGTVTMRGDRYVIPVKSEYRSFIKGFIHDQSSSGATLFIEPEAVIEYNNDLKRALFSEAEEIRRILAELSSKISYMSDGIRYNAENLCEIDAAFARAEYSFVNDCVRPRLNDNGIVSIERGRHPLIAKESVVPVSVVIGEDYNLLLITGPNTGGKTVTLKLTGLFALFAASGLFVPADRAEISVFSGVYTDIGDEQSIEQSLSTFSSHVKNLIDIIDAADEKSLVLIDEIGAGTDPEEGSALALALIKKFLSKNCFGIITTHYSKLKEFAAEHDKIENASMEFDAVSLKPLYKLNVGIPGSSNAIEIAKTLGLKQDVINDAYLFLSDKSLSFERVLKKAEESRRDSERLKEELEKIRSEEKIALEKIEEERNRISAEREKITESAKREVKRIVSDRLEEAEEIIDELKKILREAGLESKEIFRAGELKNRLKNSKYLSDYDEGTPFVLTLADEKELVKGNIVFVKSLKCSAVIEEYKSGKKEAVVLIGNAKTVVKITDLFNVRKPDKDKTEKVRVSKNTDFKSAQSEINVLGMTSIEALDKVADFLDGAVVNNIAEVKIIHGLGEGILKKEIRKYLKNEKTVKEFRRGNYGEGGDGVTIVTLK